MLGLFATRKHGDTAAPPRGPRAAVRPEPPRGLKTVGLCAAAGSDVAGPKGVMPAPRRGRTSRDPRALACAGAGADVGGPKAGPDVGGAEARAGRRRAEGAGRTSAGPKAGAGRRRAEGGG